MTSGKGFVKSLIEHFKATMIGSNIAVPIQRLEVEVDLLLENERNRILDAALADLEAKRYMAAKVLDELRANPSPNYPSDYAQGYRDACVDITRDLRAVRETQPLHQLSIEPKTNPLTVKAPT